METFKRTIPYATKALLGVLFIVSAIAKIVGMDKFELYIYSFHFFSLNLTFIIARLAIIAELILGAGLLSMTLHKPIWWASLLMTLAYTIFLIYAHAIGRSDSCHCFGELIQMNPTQSIVKNIVLIALLSVAYFAKDIKWHYAWHVMITIGLLCTTIVFIITPPDNFISYHDRQGNIETNTLNEIITSPSLSPYNLDKGRQVIGFFTPGCEYCRMAARKISLIQEFNNINADNITYIFLAGSNDDINNFFATSGSKHYKHVVYDNAKQLLTCIDGNFPTILLLNNGNLSYQYGFRDMHEDKIRQFFKE